MFGPLGAGKSFFINYLLNWGLRNEHRLENGPLPSAFGGSQTPVPIYVKFGKNVLVSVCKQKDGVSTDYETLFSEPELGKDTLARINSLLKEKFQEGGGFRDARFVEVQGPFPVFRHLKKRAMTSSGHLELEVDVEFVDLPGCGYATGNEFINVELSKADVGANRADQFHQKILHRYFVGMKSLNLPPVPNLFRCLTIEVKCHMHRRAILIACAKRRRKSWAKHGQAFSPVA